MCNVIICNEKAQNKDFTMAGHGIYFILILTSRLRENTLLFFRQIV